MIRYFHWTYPEFDDVEATTSWRGPIDYSVSGLPYIGSLGSEPGLFVAVGFSGNGVGPCYVAGQSLAAQILGGEDVLQGSALTKPQPGALPPEPFRYVGGRIVRAAIERKEAREDTGPQGRSDHGGGRAARSDELHRSTTVSSAVACRAAVAASSDDPAQHALDRPSATGFVADEASIQRPSTAADSASAVSLFVYWR